MNPKLPPFDVLISEQKIQAAVATLARTLNAEYRGRRLTLISILKGAVPFAVDLMRRLECFVELEFVSAQSYGARGAQRGPLTVTLGDSLDLQGKDVLVIDDIFDSGMTLSTVVSQLKSLKPNSLKTAVLLCKNVPRSVTFLPDYTLFEVDDLFVIGYGLDYKELYRNLPAICRFSEG